MRSFHTGELIANGRNNARAHCNVAADAEHEQHKEEQHGENLQKHILLRKTINNKTQIAALRRHSPVVRIGIAQLHPDMK